jgi:hypothetical protein
VVRSQATVTAMPYTTVFNFSVLLKSLIMGTSLPLRIDDSGLRIKEIRTKLNA